MQLQIRPQTVHHRSLRPLLQSIQGYLGTGLQWQAMSEAVVPVPEVEPEVDQTLAPRTISTSEASPGTYLFVCLAYSNQTHPPAPSERVGFALINLREKRIEFPRDGNEAQVHKPSSAHFHPWQAATSFSGISTAAERSC